jgi:hypothetical protein
MIQRLTTAQAIIGFLKRQYVEASTDEFKDNGHLHRSGRQRHAVKLSDSDLVKIRP